MVDDFWSDGNIWSCYSCEASFKLEFAFRNHLRKHDSCNQRYVCLTCDNTLKLLDVKLHISNSRKCIYGEAVLQSHYLEMLDKTQIIWIEQSDKKYRVLKLFEFYCMSLHRTAIDGNTVSDYER